MPGIFRQKISGGTAALTFASTNLAGNLIVVHAVWDDTTPRTITSIADTASNTYAAASAKKANANQGTQLWYAANIKTQASNQVTITLSGATAGWDNCFLEYGGIEVAPLDVAHEGSGTGTTADSGAATTTTDLQLIVGGCGNFNSSTHTALGGFTMRDTTNFRGTEDNNVQVPGSYSATCTMGTSVAWAMVHATFKVLRKIGPTSPTAGPSYAI